MDCGGEGREKSRRSLIVHRANAAGGVVEGKGERQRERRKRLMANMSFNSRSPSGDKLKTPNIRTHFVTNSTWQIIICSLGWEKQEKNERKNLVTNKHIRAQSYKNGFITSSFFLLK